MRTAVHTHDVDETELTDDVLAAPLAFVEKFARSPAGGLDSAKPGQTAFEASRQALDARSVSAWVFDRNRKALALQEYDAFARGI